MSIKSKLRQKGVGMGFLFLPILCLVIGVVLLFFGIKSTVHAAYVSAQYETTQGTLVDYTLEKDAEYDAARRKHTSATYSLCYQYTVDGQDYTIVTDYSTSALPALGSTRDVLYDPQDPSKSMLNGVTANTALIFIGLFFAGIPSFMLYLLLRSDRRDKKPGRVDPVGLWAGLIFALVGWGSLCMMCGSFSIKGIFAFLTTSFTLWALIPFMMLVVGILVAFKSIRFRKHTSSSHEDLS